jgi:hypothetical protein
MERRMHISFLIGAGVSIGLPGTEEITNVVRSGEGVHHGSDDLFYICQPNDLQNGWEDGYVRRIIPFIHMVNEIIINSKQLRREPNYEDLYYLVEQLNSVLGGEYDNPALQQLINSLETNTKSIRAQKPGEFDNCSFHDLLFHTLNYIQDIVWQMLYRDNKNGTHHPFLIEALNSHDVQRIDIYTLNHDTLIEETFRSSDIHYTNGFIHGVTGFRQWDRAAFNGDAALRLFKLHGSIDWFNYRPNHRGDDLLLQVPDYQESFTAPDGGRWICLIGRPEILVGTLNKMLRYTGYIYAHMFSLFWTELINSDVLIISGYGFNDKGINNRIVDWTYSAYDKRIVIINPDPDLVKNARLAIQMLVEGRAPQITMIPKPIGDVSWKEIQAAIKL